MSTSSHRKRRTPRRLVNPLDILASRSTAPIEDNKALDLALAYKGSLDGLTTEWATEEMWHTCTCALNIAQLLCEIGICPEAAQVIMDGQNALVRTREIAKNTGTWRLSKSNLFPVQCAFVKHDEQLAIASRNQVKAALDEVISRVNQGRIV